MYSVVKRMLIFEPITELFMAYCTRLMLRENAMKLGIDLGGAEIEIITLDDEGGEFVPGWHTTNSATPAVYAVPHGCGSDVEDSA